MLDLGKIHKIETKGRVVDSDVRSFFLCSVDYRPHQTVSFGHQKPRVCHWDDGRLLRLLGYIECIGRRCWRCLYLRGTVLHCWPPGSAL